MSWLTIIGVVIQVLRAAGVFDWLANWIQQLLEKWAVGKPDFATSPATMGDMAGCIEEMFEETRPGWGNPMRRLAHGICRSVAERNVDVIWGVAAGKPLEKSHLIPLDGFESGLLSRFNQGDDMNADFVAMVEDMDTTFGAEGSNVGANPASAFFDGTIIAWIRDMRAAGFTDWLKWLPVVLQLITTIGPKIAEIVQLIKDAINQGKTPKEVLSDLVVAN